MNLSDLDLHKFPGSVQASETRILQDTLCASTETVVNWMLTCEKQQVVTYAPSSKEDIRKIVVAWKKTQGRRKALKVLMLVAALAPIHFGRSVMEIREQAEHPLLDPKFQDVVNRQRVLQPPVPITSMTSKGPEMAMRSLLVVNIMDRAKNIPLELCSWARTIEVPDEQVRCVIEVKEVYGWQVKCLLDEAGLPLLVRVDAPRRSRAPATQRSSLKKNSCIWLHFQKTAYDNILHREAILTWIKTQLAPFGVLVGWENMVKDKDALILEFSNIEAVHQQTDLIRECFMLTNQKCLISTHANADSWEEAITKQWRSNPLCTIDRVTSRGAKEQQVTFASIRATRQVIEDSKVVAKARRGSSEENDSCLADIVRCVTVK